MKKFASKFLALTAAAAVLFAGFGALPADAARKGFDPKKVGGKLVISSFADAVRLTPYTVSDSASFDIIGMVYDALLSVDFYGNPIPALAEKYTFDSKTNTYTFYLRKGVKFHDGKPMTAKDVVFSYEMYTHPKSINPYKGDFSSIASVKALNDYTVQIKLKEKDVFFLNNVAVNAAIMPKHQFPKGIDDFNSNNKIHRNPIGTGPFKFKEWRSAERIVVTANTSYWDGRPYMDEVIYRIVPDSNVEVLNLIKGTVDFVSVITPDKLATVSKEKNVKTVTYDYGRFDFVGFNLKKEPWNDKNVRLALAYGLDRPSIVSKILLGKAYLSSGPMHPKIPQNNPNVKPLPYDPAKANQLLDQAGWKKGPDGIRQKNGKKLVLEFAYNQGNKVREKIALLAQQNWGKLGVKVTPRSYEWSIFLDKYRDGVLDCFFLAWGGYDTNVEHYGFFHSSQIPTATFPGNNRNRVDDPYIDKILEDYKQESDRNKRIKMYQDLHKYMADNEILIWSHHPRQTAGMNKDLAGYKFPIFNELWNLIDWYWANPAKRKK